MDDYPAVNVPDPVSLLADDDLGQLASTVIDEAVEPRVDTKPRWR